MNVYQPSDLFDRLGGWFTFYAVLLGCLGALAWMIAPVLVDMSEAVGTYTKAGL